MKFNNGSNTIQAFWLGIGSLVSFSFGIVSAAILSRYLSKSDYGTYKQVLYVYNTLLVVFSLGMPRAYSYFLARAPIEEGRSIVRKMNSLFLVLGIVFAIVLFCASSIFADMLKNPDLKGNLQLFSITPVFLLPLLGIESIMVTYKKAYINTVYVIFSRLFSLLCVIAPVLCFDASVYAAVGGFVISSLLCCLLGLYLENRLFLDIEKRTTSIKVSDILKFSIPLLVASLWGIIISSANQFFVSRYWGNGTFAEFSNGFIELPFASMVISAAATVLLPVFSKMVYERTDNKVIVDLWKSVAMKSAKIIFPLAIFSYFFAEPIMILLYGEQYASSAIYFQIITVVNLVRIVPYAPIVMALGKVKAYANVHLITAIMIVVLEFISVHLFCEEPYVIAIMSVICTVFSLFLQMRIICNALNVSISDLIPYNPMLKILFCSLLSSILTKIFCSFLGEFSALKVVVMGIFLFIGMYILICRKVKISYMEILNIVLR